MKPLHIVLGVSSAAALAGLVLSLRKGHPVDFSLQSIRDTIVSNANAAVGLTASGDPTAFEDFLGGSGEASNMKHDMALAPSSSTCGLTARAIYRESGFTDKSFSPPYEISTAISAFRDLAIKAGAWVTPDSGLTPQRGDVVMGDVDKPTGHVWTITSADPAALTFESVDGGVVDGNGRQSVARRTRKWSHQGGSVVDTPNMGNAHVITGWVDAEKLAAYEGIS